MDNSRFKHVFHCTILFIIFVISYNYITFSSTNNLLVPNVKDDSFDPWIEYGYTFCTILYILRLMIIMPFPQILINFIGLTFYNAFTNEVRLQNCSLLTPLICIRVVTRGNFPRLVRDNVAQNMAKCTEAGMENFIIEVVTEKAIGLPRHKRMREIVVPLDYRTSTGALYKSRALQYCLEDGVNILADNDWIIHLDEETLLTKNSIKGILNFILQGKYHFGQGLITYANEKIVNWVTTMADMIRVAEDMGKIRAQFRLFHKPIFSWKGSYIVAQVGAERKVSYDSGIGGSLAEDAYFAVKAYKEGFTFDFIEGEMWEKSPFTISDFVQQRKRWFQGVKMVVHSPELPLKYKFFVGLSWYTWCALPIFVLNAILSTLFPVPAPSFINFMCAFAIAVNIHMYLFGVLKSFSIHRIGIIKFACCLLASICMIPVTMMLEASAVFAGTFSPKRNFYIVKKDTKTEFVV